MYQETFLAFLVVIMVFSVSGEVYHEAEANEDYVQVNSTVQLQCTDNCPVNQWSFSYTLPESSEIQKIQDSYGEIDEYTLHGEEIEIDTNRGRAREQETLEFQYRIEKPAEQLTEGLHTRQISFAGFEGEETRGTIEIENLISGRVSRGFQASYNDSLDFTGKGPVQVNFNTGQGLENKYYSFFNDFSESSLVNSSEEVYEIALGTVGSQQSFEKFPVVIYDENYQDQGFEWSAGEYSAGLIKLREDDDIRPVLAHETVHGLNSDLLDWDRSSSAWFEEGVAKHVEDLVRRQLYSSENSDRRPGMLFGSEVSYTDFGEGLTYTVPSRGDREELWDYYQGNSSFMKDWAPRKGNRNFGYAYSELVVKNYLREGGEIHELYSEVDPGRVVESNSEKWSIYAEHMDLRPCDHDSRQQFDECLNEINEYEYELRTAEPVDNRTGIEVNEIEIQERSPGQIEAFILKIDELINNLFEEVLSIWKNS